MIGICMYLSCYDLFLVFKPLRCLCRIRSEVEFVYFRTAAHGELHGGSKKSILQNIEVITYISMR